jgi:hypothetical protein
MISAKFGSTLLLRALEDKVLELPEDKEMARQILSDLTDSKKKCRAFNRYIQYRNIKFLEYSRHDEMFQFLTETYRDEFCLLKCNGWGSPVWNIFGCNETNRDYDVAVLVIFYIT